MQKGKIYLYFLLLGLNILAGIFSVEMLLYLTKPLLMPVLIWILWSSKSSPRLKIWLTVALLFSLMGDVFLLGSGQSYFIVGLGSFLIAQLCYVFIFKRKFDFKPLLLLPIGAYFGLFVFGILWGQIEANLQIPVYVYMFAIMGMGITALMRQTGQKSYLSVLVGAILFILSDSFIAINTFVHGIPLASFWVMCTYGLAQYFILSGLLLEESEIDS